jgi:hypothetical protein
MVKTYYSFPVTFVFSCRCQRLATVPIAMNIASRVINVTVVESTIAINITESYVLLQYTGNGLPNQSNILESWWVSTLIDGYGHRAGLEK